MSDGSEDKALTDAAKRRAKREEKRQNDILSSEFNRLSKLSSAERVEVLRVLKNMSRMNSRQTGIITGMAIQLWHYDPAMTERSRSAINAWLVTHYRGVHPLG